MTINGGGELVESIVEVADVLTDEVLVGVTGVLTDEVLDMDAACGCWKSDIHNYEVKYVIIINIYMQHVQVIILLQCIPW